MDEMDNLHFYLVHCDDLSDKSVMDVCEKDIRSRLKSKPKITVLGESDCLEKSTEELEKTDIFVFSQFEGDAFEHVRKAKKALILGIQCLRYTLENDVAIPNNGQFCVLNSAMYGLVISFTNIKDPEKSKYINYVELMGGICVPHLSPMCTHLVANTILSHKYEQATTSGIKVMRLEWIKEVWDQNKSTVISATDPSFDQFKLPVFYNANMTCSNLDNKLKMKIEKIIIENGGNFYRSLKPNVTDILIVNENGRDSEKFKVAVKYEKRCLIPEWIFDSVQSGYAVSMGDYEVSSERKSSTPKKDKKEDVPEFSLSRIQIQGSGNTTANETQLSVRSHRPLSPVADESGCNDTSSDSSYKEILKGLTITAAKKAGQFLDGCSIFFSGFTPSELTKLNKIVSTSGATRYDELDDNVTHVIIGKRVESELKFFKQHNILIYFLKLDWLVDSINQKLPAKEEEHSFAINITLNSEPEPPSPASKRNIVAMNSSFKKPLPLELGEGPSKYQKSKETSEMGRQPNENLMNRYLHSTSSNMVPVAELREREQSRLMHSTFDSEVDTEDYENLNFFVGKKFYVQCDNAEESLQMIQDIRNFGGRLVDKSFKGEVDYLVVPADALPNFEPDVKTKMVVNNLWMEDVISERKEVAVVYYHKPMIIKDEILTGIRCTISTYSGSERIFLHTLCKALGATVEERYAKNSFPVLICEKPEGSKYKGALNWEFPVVNKEWVLDCYANNALYRLQDYLIGDSIISRKHEKFIELNSRGLAKGELPMFESQDVVIQTQSQNHPPLAGPSGLSFKRKSVELLDNNEGDSDSDAVFAAVEKRFKLDGKSPPGRNNRVLALRSGSKSSSPVTPISKHLKDVDFGYDTPRRKFLYDVLKETENKTPHTPHTPQVMKMPETPLHPDPDASPGSQWNVIHKFSGFMDKKKTTKPKPTTSTTPLSEIKRRFWMEAIGEDNYQSATFVLNSQWNKEKENDNQNNKSGVNEQDKDNSHTNDEGEKNNEGIQPLLDLISKRKSEPKPPPMIFETCPDYDESPKNSRVEMMVDFEDPDIVRRRKGKEVPYFILSAVECKKSLIDNVMSLNGKIQDNMKIKHYESQCTHVLCSKIGRMEKVLCGLAAGKWLLSPKYIEDSAKAGRFLNEELYQWGNSQATANLPPMSTFELELATAACNWKRKIQTDSNFSKGAFQGFKCLLISKVEGFKRLIEAGGGVVLDVERPYNRSVVARGATHMFVDKKTNLEKSDYNFSLSNNIPVYTANYLNEYLLNEKSDKLKEYEIKM